VRTANVDQMTAAPSGQQLYRVTEAMAILAMSRSVIYEEMRSGRLGWVKRGRSRRISAADIADYLALLKAETKRRVAS
jgi:excisionase family DNA binding protein